MVNNVNEKLRKLPSVTEILAMPEVLKLQTEFGAGLVKFELRTVIDEYRVGIKKGERLEEISPEVVSTRLRSRLSQTDPQRGRRAINATGIILHTGLGRAPLSQQAVQELAQSQHYVRVETSVESGKRGRRDGRVSELVSHLVGCESATVVNNNAAATFLVLNTIAVGKEVIISRGQLIEIGGSYRLPDVMTQSGVKLREIGTTNKTHLKDYESALSERTGAILHVHPSNYRIHGFQGAPSLGELAALAKKHNVPLIEDLGSGALVPLEPYGLKTETLVTGAFSSGADVVCFSGDKLIGGPQSGIVCGKEEFIAKVRENSFYRMFRVGKLTLGALERTLIHFVNNEFESEVPLYQLLKRGVGELELAAESLIRSVSDVGEVKIRMFPESAYVGGGAMPEESLPSVVVGVRARVGAEELSRRLRSQAPAVFARIHDGEVLLDMRTVFEEELGLLAAALRASLNDGA